MVEEKNRLIIEVEDDIDRAEVFGCLDANVREIEKRTGAEITQRGNSIVISGGDGRLAESILNELMDAQRVERRLDRQKVSYIMDMAGSGMKCDSRATSSDIICYTHHGKPLKPKTIGQKRYVDSIRNNELVFGIGPAGTGKTYLACAMAVTAYKNKEVDRIVLTRPAVEAGEKLGFLPGDMQDKVDPYLRPLYDALFDILGQEAASKLKEKGTVEVVPLAYMRGRTLDNSFIILDEAQNTTREQMKMFLTRMGFGSRMVVTGDITQIDLPRGVASGLKEACRILKDVEGIDIKHLTDADVVRHELVKRIIRAYDSYEKNH